MVTTIALTVLGWLIILAVLNHFDWLHVFFKIWDGFWKIVSYIVAVGIFWYCVYEGQQYVRQSTPLTEQEWKYFILCVTVPIIILLMVILETILYRKK